MRILDLTSYYPPHRGGVEFFAADLHQALLSVDETVEVTVLTSRLGLPGDEPRSERLRVVRYRAWEPVSSFCLPRPRSWRAACRAVECRGFDVVVSHTRFYPSSLLARRLANRMGCPWIHIEHGTTPVQAGGRGVRAVARAWDLVLGRRVLRHADSVFGISLAAVRFVRDLAGVDATLIRRGIDMEDLAESAHAGQTDQIVFVGRLVDAKGVSELLTALSLVLARRPRTRLRLVGEGPDRPRLERQAARLGIEDAVEFVGELDRDEAHREMQRANLFVNPSHTEGLPTTVLEAAWLGIPIIATNVGGTSEIIQHDRTGVLVEPHRPEQLASAIERLLAGPAQAARLGSAARDDVRHRFSWDSAARELLEHVSTLTTR